MDSSVHWTTCKRSHPPLARAGITPPDQRVSISDIFPAAAADGAAVGFVLCALDKARAPVLWVQDRVSQREAGRPYLPGLGQRHIIQADVSRATDVLWSLEEGLGCSTLGAVIGEIWGDPAQLDFTATKRLALRAEAHGVPCWLIRRGGTPNLSAARNRWRVASLPSAPHPHDPKSPGAPRWQVELFRSRGQPTGTWVASYDRATDRLDFAAPVRDGAVAEGDGTSAQRATG